LRSFFACTLTSRSVGIGYPSGLRRPGALVSMVTRSGHGSQEVMPTTQPKVTAYLICVGMRNRESVRLALLNGPILPWAGRHWIEPMNVTNPGVVPMPRVLIVDDQK